MLLLKFFRRKNPSVFALSPNRLKNHSFALRCVSLKLRGIVQLNSNRKDYAGLEVHIRFYSRCSRRIFHLCGWNCRDIHHCNGNRISLNRNPVLFFLYPGKAQSFPNYISWLVGVILNYGLSDNPITKIKNFGCFV